MKALRQQYPIDLHFAFSYSNSKYPVAIRSAYNRPTDQAQLTIKKTGKEDQEKNIRSGFRENVRGPCSSRPRFRSVLAPSRRLGLGWRRRWLLREECRVEGRRCGRVSRWSLPDFGWLERSCVASLGLRACGLPQTGLRH